MSKLEELIAELCPDGVKYKELWEVTIWDKRFNAVDNNKQPRIIKYPSLLAKDLFALEQKDGDVFLLSTGEQTGWTTEAVAGDKLCKGEVVSIPWGKSRAVKDVMKYYKGKFVTADNRIATSSDVDTLLNKYLYYWMMTQSDIIDSFYRGSGLKHPSMKDVLDMKIPVPPIEVQNEIVRILDNFTELTAELTADLTAELTARKKQYEYYRKQALCFDGNTPMERLGDTCLMKSGKAIKATFISETQSKTNQYKCYGGNGVRGFVSELSHQGEYPIIGRQGALCGNINYAVGDFYATEHAVVVKSLGKYIPRFLFYLLTAMNLNQYKSQGAQPGLAVGNIENLLAPVPSIKKQEYIVNLLDRFDTLCNDISTGLPAEIEARQKQYEYYRDKLLTFKESSDEN